MEPAVCHHYLLFPLSSLGGLSLTVQYHAVHVQSLTLEGRFSHSSAAGGEVSLCLH